MKSNLQQLVRVMTDDVNEVQLFRSGTSGHHSPQNGGRRLLPLQAYLRKSPMKATLNAAMEALRSCLKRAALLGGSSSPTHVCCLSELKRLPPSQP